MQQGVLGEFSPKCLPFRVQAPFVRTNGMLAIPKGMHKVFSGLRILRSTLIAYYVSKVV